MNWLLYFFDPLSRKKFGDSRKFDLPPAKEGVKNLGNSPSPSPLPAGERVNLLKRT
jgi:hypothetical protein